jgi:hypothetical protein
MILFFKFLNVFFDFLILFSGSHGLMVVIQTLVYALDSGVYVFLVYDLVGSFIINVRIVMSSEDR